MSVRVLSDVQQDMSCLYDSVTETAFGPVFQSMDEAERFLDWLTTGSLINDARRLEDGEWSPVLSAWQEHDEEHGNDCIVGSHPWEPDEDDDDE